MRKPRPTRTDLEQRIRTAGGNLSAVAAGLGVSRQTLYTWTYQLGLERVAGIALDAGKAPAAPSPGLGALRLARSVKLTEECWRWVRIHAIKTGGTASGIVEEALDMLRARVEGAAARPA